VSEHERSAVVIEDDPDVRALLTELLKQSGFAVAEAASGAEGIRLVRESDADLVTLDLNLPDLDGIEVCRRIRETSEAYIVMLTGRPDEIDRLVGLETGADDYLTKPFSPRELRARVAAMMRRPRRRLRRTPPRRNRPACCGMPDSRWTSRAASRRSTVSNST
jgi:DNA-binding response OmpR family regulator